MEREYFIWVLIKKVLLTLLLFVPMELSAGEYMVTKIGVDVYTSPDRNHDAVCKLNYGKRVSCDFVPEAEFQYVTFDDKEGWIYTSFLGEIPSVSDGQQNLSASNNTVRRGIVLEYHAKFAHESKGAMTLLLFLGILLLVLCLVISNTGSSSVLFAMIAVDFIMFLIEIYHIVGFSGDVTWFYSPSQIGWMWSIINFFLCIIVIGVQALVFRFGIEHLSSYGGSYYSPMPGLIGTVCGLGAFFICGMFFFDLGAQICVYVVLGVQLLQILYMVYMTIRNQGNWVVLLITVLFYIVGLTALILDIAAVLPSVICIGICILVSDIIDYSSHSSWDPNQKTGPKVDIHQIDGDSGYYYEDGTRHDVTYIGSGSWRDDRGRLYEGDGTRRL